jgi:hypothetical protein
VSVAVEGEEFSDTRAEDVLNALLRSRVQVHIVRLGRMTLAQSNPMEMNRGESLANESIHLNSVLGQAPSRTGGRSEQLAQHSGIPRAMDQIATELLAEYALTFEIADPRAREVKLEVETSRRGLKVRAPNRVGVGR